MFKVRKTQTFAIIAITTTIFLSACNSSVIRHKKDDTSIVLKILLDSAFYKPRLALATQLDGAAPFGDTIIFQYNDILIHHLPERLSYKLLTEDEICELMTTRKTSHLQFLALDELIKTTHGYRAALGTHCMVNGTETSYPNRTSHSFCRREKYCNVILHMDVIKRRNNLAVGKFMIVTY